MIFYGLNPYGIKISDRGCTIFETLSKQGVDFWGSNFFIYKKRPLERKIINLCFYNERKTKMKGLRYLFFILAEMF